MRLNRVEQAFQPEKNPALPVQNGLGQGNIWGVIGIFTPPDAGINEVLWNKPLATGLFNTSLKDI